MSMSSINDYVGKLVSATLMTPVKTSTGFYYVLFDYGINNIYVNLCLYQQK